MGAPFEEMLDHLLQHSGLRDAHRVDLSWRGTPLSIHSRSPRGAQAAASALALIIVCGFAGPAEAASRPSLDVPAGLARADAIYAQIEASPHPEQAYAALADADKGVVRSYLLPATTTKAVSIAPTDATAARAVADGAVGTTFTSEDDAIIRTSAVGGCWTGTVKTTAHAPAGNAIWDVWVEGAWCADSTVTSAAFHRSWATIAAPGWQDRGEIGSGAGFSGGTAKIWAQRRMVFGAAGWDLQTTQQCARIIGNARGHVRGDLACSTV
ncbi:hypothetical protein [Clavibacter michiganensis]|uniref:hypothetical protein n=2 Tax=Clavibacter michiganensis TaxID=28447 RepID=UPI001365B7E0|nr:hypothetical protein [Clavibacter michiganensis]